MRIPREYKKFLISVVNSYRKARKPISKVIMAETLGSMFNLSPEYCKEIVQKLYKN